MPMFNQSPVSGDAATQGDFNGYYRVAAWGDSFVDIGAAWFQEAMPRFGVHYGGYSGANSTTIKNAMLAATDRLRDITIIWSGRNNFASPATVKADIAAMVAALEAPKRFLVLSIFNGAGEPAGSANYNTIMALNADLAALYGANYLDVRTPLVAAYNPALPQDVIDHSNDVPPLSLRSDPLHYNPAGARMVAALVAAWVDTLVLPADAKLVTLQGANWSRQITPAYDVLNISTTGVIRIGGRPVASADAFASNFYLAGAAATVANAGTQNIAIGPGAMRGATDAGGNMALGEDALRSVTTGDGNMAIGVRALTACNTGFNCAAVGTAAMVNAVNPNNSVAIGYSAASGMVSGSSNVIVGANALGLATAVNGVIAIGAGAMQNATKAYASVGVGGGCLGKYNGNQAVALGVNSLQNATNADGVIGIGFETLTSLVSGYRTIAIGFRAGQGATGHSSIFIGPWAGDKETGNDRLAVDNRSRASESDARDLSIISGEMADTAGVQKLRLNAATRVLTTTVSGLPAATIGAGYRAFVTDANATTFAIVVAGGGSNGVPVYSDGTDWRIG